MAMHTETGDIGGIEPRSIFATIPPRCEREDGVSRSV